MKINKLNLRLRNFAGLTLAGVINAFGVTLLLSPVGLIDSGLSGTSMLLGRLTPDYLPLSFFLLVLNFPFFLFGLKKQGGAFTIYSLYAIAVYSLLSLVFTRFIPFKVDITSVSPIGGSDLILCAVFGGLISGVGSGMTIRFGGAIDGIEVTAVVFAKRLGVTVGSFVMAYNVVLYVATGLIFSSWAIPLYSIIAYAVGIKAVDFVVEGLDKGKSVFIVTSEAEEVSREISEVFGRGLTLIDCKGYFSQENKIMLYCVVNRFQIGRLTEIISRHDKTAFVTVSDVTDVLGNSLDLGNVINRKNRAKTGSVAVSRQIMPENNRTEKAEDENGNAADD